MFNLWKVNSNVTFTSEALLNCGKSVKINGSNKMLNIINMDKQQNSECGT
jgi:hypothetical protein